jgi:hypothetical protein
MFGRVDHRPMIPSMANHPANNYGKICKLTGYSLDRDVLQVKVENESVSDLIIDIKKDIAQLGWDVVKDILAILEPIATHSTRLMEFYVQVSQLLWKSFTHQSTTLGTY